MRRTAMIDQLADAIVAIDQPHPTRVAADGFTASGKTSLADELVAPIARRGRHVVRASLDNFKHPWAERHLYDRETGAGYYRNAYNYDLVRSALLEPLGPGGNRQYLSGHLDPATQRRIEGAQGTAPDDAVLIVDAVFLFRPELNRYWDYRIFVDIDFDLVLARGLERDRTQETSIEALEAVYRDRYIASERLYVAEVDPKQLADVVVNNSDFNCPILHWTEDGP